MSKMNLTKHYRSQQLREKNKGINQYFQPKEVRRQYELEFPYKRFHCDRRYKSKKERDDCVCTKPKDIGI